MESIFKLKKQLKEINSVLEATYGRNGKSALIQSTNKDTQNKSFFSTNDGISILKSIHFDETSLINLVLNTIQCHSSTSGDNCKTLFFYHYACLSVMSAHDVREESEQILCYLRSNSLYRVYQKFLDEWLDIFKTDTSLKIFRCLNTISDFKFLLPNLAVIHDLHNSNETFSNKCSQLVIDLITYNLPESLSLLPDTLVNILQDFETCLFYSDKQSINKTQLLTDGFLVDRRFILKMPALFDGRTQIKAILLEKQLTEQIDNGPNTFLRINSDLKGNLMQCFNTGDEMKFSTEFLESLKFNGVNLILTASSLNDLKKAQLSSINCSCIGYIDLSYIGLLSRKLGVGYVESKDKRSDEIEQKIINIESIENLENESMFYFRLSDIHPRNIKVWSIHFCAPAKMFLQQFKAYFVKVFRNFSNLFETPADSFVEKKFTNIALICNKFEQNSSEIFAGLAKSQANSNQERLFFKYISKVFDDLDFNLNKDKGQIKRFKANSALSENLDLSGSDNSDGDIRFEAFTLKMKCFLSSVQLLQSIGRIESVHCVKKRISELKQDSQSDSDE